MVDAAPLLGKNVSKHASHGNHGKASIFYGADEYLDVLKAKFERDHEIASMNGLLPDGGDPNAKDAGGKGEKKDKMLSVQKNDENRSHKTGRLFPTPNKPDPMPNELAFLFTKITAEQMMYMWNILTLIFITQNAMVLVYAASLVLFPSYWWTCTLTFGIPFAYLAIQNIYIDHDVMHGATFPPYNWQKFITHPFSDFFSLPWEEFVLEHQRHHASTVDLLCQGEFGWDPEEFQYWLLEWTWRYGKKPFPITLSVSSSQGPCFPSFISLGSMTRVPFSRLSGISTFQTKALVASAIRSSGINGFRAESLTIVLLLVSGHGSGSWERGRSAVTSAKVGVSC
jgi:hypothetical protein